MISNLKTIVGSGLLLGALIFLSSCHEEMEVVQTVNEEFTGITQIDIESEFLEVNYQGVEGQDFVSLSGQLESSRSGKFKIEYKVEGNTLHVELEQNGPFGGGNNRGNLYLIGPKLIDLEIESGSGSIHVNGVEFPELEFSAGSGSMELWDITTQSLALEVGSGSITGTDIIGNVKVEASSGRISLKNVRGNVKSSASSGSVELRNIEGTVNSELSSGKLYLDGVDEVQSLKVSSGNIEAYEVGLGANTSLNSSSGIIRLQTFSTITAFNYDLEAGSGRVSVGGNSSSGSLKINNGAPYTVRGRVSSGTIEIKN